MLLTLEQKKLILGILRKERRSWLSRHRGGLLDKTIADLEQTIRNEEVNVQEKRL